MKSTTSLALIVGAIIGLSPGLANAGYIFDLGHDAELRQKFPDLNAGAMPTLTIDADDNSGEIDDAQSVLRGAIFGFGAGLIEPLTHIQGATLTLYVENRGDAILMHRMNAGWDESSVTWNHFGSDGIIGDATFLRTLEGGVDGPVGNTGLIEIDVTEEVQYWSDNGGNFGWGFTPADQDEENGVDFATSEFGQANLRPQLAVTVYSDVDEPATLAIFGLGLAGLGYMRRRRAA